MTHVQLVRRTTEALVSQVCPVRNPDTHKGHYGRILLLCGSEGFTGAPVLAAKAALRAGAGLIYVGVPRSAYPLVASRLTAPMVLPLPDENGRLSLRALPLILDKLRQMDACLMGPGLGRSPALDLLVRQLVRQSPCPIILDADGINAVAAHRDVLREACSPVILTPHEGEFRRLTDGPERSRLEGARRFAQWSGATVVRKSHETIITDGKETYVNHTGNAGMAVGGSGDVLAGLLTALVGQCVAQKRAGSLVRTAAAAVWLHGTAGDLAAADLGQYAMGPLDEVERLSRLLP